LSEIRVNAPNGHNADRPVVSAGPVGVFAVVEPGAAERVGSNRRRERREVTLRKGSLAVQGHTLEVMELAEEVWSYQSPSVRPLETLRRQPTHGRVRVDLASYQDREYEICRTRSLP
jgi:hypothetical protein